MGADLADRLTLPAGLVGRSVGPVEQVIDAGWLAAYAGALGQSGVPAHPVFPVCYEWPAILAVRDALPPSVALRGVHATHDLQLRRLPRAGDRLSTTATVVRVAPRPSGALVVVRLETLDAAGALVGTTDHGTVYRGVECEAAGADAGEPPPATPPGPRWSTTVAVPAGLAHAYSEGSRIWNPIHTDRAVARAAGLPAVLLHGTATLALAVSAVLAREAGGDRTRVRRVTARFGAPVWMPSTLEVGTLGVQETAEGRRVAFEARTPDGGLAVRDGALLHDQP
jgi:acyl dehydratase